MWKPNCLEASGIAPAPRSVLVSLVLAAALLFPGWQRSSLAGSADDHGESSAGGWRVGYAEADITPQPRQTQMAGFGRERYAEGAIAPLISQAVALRDPSGKTAVLVTADVVGLDRILVEVYRHKIVKKHKLDPAGVMFASSHTHWGPPTRLNAHLSCGGPNVWYLAKLEGTILQNVAKALKNLAPATIDYAHTKSVGIAACRRLYKGGKVHWAPNSDGRFDDHVPIVRIRREGSPKQLLIVGHASHPTSSGAINKYSPDYPGAMRDVLNEALEDSRAIFVQGCGGDAKIVHKDPQKGKLVFSAHPDRARQAGEKLARLVLARLERKEFTPVRPGLKYSLVSGTLTYGEPWPDQEIRKVAFDGSPRGYLTWNARQFLGKPDVTESFRYDVQVWRLDGDLTIVGMEGEVCAPWGPIVRAMADVTREAMVVGYANSITSYIPDAQIMREGGYEAVRAHMYFKPAPFTEKVEDEVKAVVRKGLRAVE